MSAPLVLPFNFDPESIAVGVGTYTVPSGYHAIASFSLMENISTFVSTTSSSGSATVNSLVLITTAGYADYSAWNGVYLPEDTVVTLGCYVAGSQANEDRISGGTNGLGDNPLSLSPNIRFHLKIDGSISAKSVMVGTSGSMNFSAASTNWTVNLNDGVSGPLRYHVALYPKYS